ncbi:hypothetical protein ACJ72_06962 [Emergomyces africanus]|uniref:Uncharacterized protein n=1 Tax=Emergomyces africanus TaxID=1955775 RepID=A0A1B7NQ44_9EURO|nr:hypothetical protein ACJ72_06962 [Emergomyces africanus]
MILYLLVGVLALSIPTATAEDGCDGNVVDCLSTIEGQISQKSARELSTVHIYSPITTITLPRRDVAATAFPTAALGPPVAATPEPTMTTLVTVAGPGYPATPLPPSTSTSPDYPEHPENPPSPENPGYPPPAETPETSFPTAPISNPPPEYETPETPETLENPGYPPPAAPTASSPPPEYETPPKDKTPPSYGPQAPYETGPVYRPRAFSVRRARRADKA